MITKYSSLRGRLVGTVFIAIAPAWVLMYYVRLPWTGFAVGLLALVAAWIGGEHFIIRQVRLLLRTTEQLASGNLSIRTGLTEEPGELGELAGKIDLMAEKLEQRAQERERVEQSLLARSLQQTVVSSLGQFAIASPDYNALVSQSLLFVTQTLEIEFCHVMELTQDGKGLWIRAGSGW